MAKRMTQQSSIQSCGSTEVGGREGRRGRVSVYLPVCACVCMSVVGSWPGGRMSHGRGQGDKRGGDVAVGWRGGMVVDAGAHGTDCSTA